MAPMANHGLIGAKVAASLATDFARALRVGQVHRQICTSQTPTPTASSPPPQSNRASALPRHFETVDVTFADEKLLVQHGVQRRSAKAMRSALSEFAPIAQEEQSLSSTQSPANPQPPRRLQTYRRWYLDFAIFHALSHTQRSQMLRLSILS